MTAPGYTPDPALARFAAEQLRARQRIASDVVKSGRMARDEAEARLRPWLAIACHAGSDIDELTDEIAQRRVVQRYPGAHPGDCGEGEARRAIADELATRGQCRAALVTARDRAMDALAHDRTGRGDAEASLWLALCDLLDVRTPYRPGQRHQEKAA